jgi:formylglycine-generating enzyme required for sulfatase activity
MYSHKFFFLSLCFCALFAGSSYAQDKGFSAKTIEGKMAMINELLYASRYETTNSEYTIFLKELALKDPDLYRRCAIDTAKWETVSAYCGPLTQFYHSHPVYSKFPVVNVSFEGAVEYCKWLTAQYNNAPKRKFRKVEFILPSAGQWTIAARGGYNNARYSWIGYNMRDKKGMYQCNFRRIDETFVVRDSLGRPSFDEFNRLRDMGFYTAEVRSYKPNEFGLYNTCGNVAEWVDLKDSAMGGSWNSFGGEVTTTSIKSYNSPSPEVGFRIFMRVVVD